MHTHTARQASGEEFPQLVEWMHANRAANRYDPEIFSYHSTRVIAVDRDEEPILYLPYQLVIMTESLAPRPGLSKRETAVGLRAAIHHVARIAKHSKIAEMYFLGTDDETVEFAKQHGYEEVKDVRVMRLKPGRMNPPLPEDKE
jgi:hypothetical protein